MKARLLFVHALSPLHAGTGQGIGVIDLPIAREKATNLPILPGSSLKGSLRDACTAENGFSEVDCKDVFGLPSTERPEDYAGSAQFTDQRLLLLPVRSLLGTFAWVTSPFVLRRFKREALEAGVKNLPDVPTPAADNQCKVSNETCALTVDLRVEKRTASHVILEDLELQADADADTAKWAAWLGAAIFPASEDAEWRALLAARLCIVHDDAFNFLMSTATEVVARVKLLDDAKTVQQGGLWYEEALPAETVLAGLVVATPVKTRNKSDDAILAVVQKLTGKTIQLGGKATVGRGLCRTTLSAGS